LETDVLLLAITVHMFQGGGGGGGGGGGSSSSSSSSDTYNSYVHLLIHVPSLAQTRTP